MRDFVYVFSSFVIAFIVSNRAIPSLINVSQQLNLFSEPNARSANINRIPTLGGVAIFIGFILGLTLTRNGYILPGLTFIIAAVMIMFFVGLKDDIVTLSPTKKIISQFFAAGILILLGHFRFTNLHGIFGVEIISIWISVPLTAFVIIVFINAFNLIDGIDGLAAGISIFAASVFGLWFFLSDHPEYAIVSFSLVGALLGFFFFNVYGKKNKIFMGDTGSLILGTIMSVLVIEFNEFNIDHSLPYAVLSAPAVSFGILIYPLMDTLRVFTIRIINKKSPFEADKNHTHHRLLTLGMTHASATYLILSVNAVFAFAVFYLQGLGDVGLMIFNYIIGGILLLVPSIIVSKKKLISPDDPSQEIVSFGKYRRKGRLLVAPTK